MRTLRLMGIGGALAYRALFNWTTPAMYTGTLLAGPTFQLLFFAYLGRQLQVADDRFFIVGNAVLAASTACVFGGTMAVANERRYGTLGHVLLSPRSRTVVFWGRVLPYAGNGLLIAAFTLLMGVLLLGLRIPASALPGLALALAAGSLACGFFGLTLGALGLRFRDVWVVSNVSAALLLLLTGVNVPRDGLPDWMITVGQLLPITHAAEAARLLAAGRGLDAAAPALGRELLVGAGYAVLAALLLKVFEAESRRRASLETL
ncbi:ABC-2 type transport system permease protein [Actinoplanes campanulatus]|uniref:ABC-2 type transport system permease protein n=1 Tax=Actinoplanes campanulatus TaxID=113559 RepID=A0A7W5APL0_9ACTN|nr:ABC transporter permease [Actinoplanes campanulatus]MBB3100096.1 ABC-2 type transport system permease protein [Actinoplanes campanulatus]